MNRIYCVEDPNLEQDFPKKWPAYIHIDAKDKKEYSLRIEYPKGDPENALTWDELLEKFRDLSSCIYQQDRQNSIIEQVKKVDKQSNLESFFDHLAK